VLGDLSSLRLESSSSINSTATEEQMQEFEYEFGGCKP
jgi:hypothetical protein